LQHKLADDRVREFERIFYPRSIALVGASKDSRKMGSRWAKALIDSGFNGPVYPVNPSGGEFFTAKVYSSLKAIPGPVDLVICCIPRAFVLDLLDDCAAKQVSAVHFFTAGFRETGEAQWIHMEEEVARRAQKGGFRIIGPNCIGVSCPEHKLPYGASSVVGKPGPVGFISQSGGHAGKLMVIGLTRGIGFSKIASIGNCCDLGSADFLEYMAIDPKTNVVGLYLEGPRDIQRLFEVMRAASERKPVVVWKGGATEAGAKAALKSLVQRPRLEIPAVDNISFDLASGEIVGFLGPNGAGKTTTLKMLSGLLFPTSGTPCVLGFQPCRRQAEFLQQITLVMGNRSQMSWDLPSLDSFELQRAIYGIPHPEFEKTRDEFIELLEVKDLVKKPVRNLSLGERMKMEFIMSLLHRPKVLFLDEPTIGLDVTMQRRIRQFVEEYNQRTGATILLTSHYMADVEALCHRVIVIHNGKILFDGDLSRLLDRFSAFKTISVTLAKGFGSFSQYGEVLNKDVGHVVLRIPREKAPAITARILAEQQVDDLTVEDPPIEDIIEKVFSLKSGEMV